MRKLIICMILLISCLYPLATAPLDSKTLQLSTDIAPYAMFKIFNGNGDPATNEILVPGEELQLSYSCMSNQYLKLVVDSTNNLKLNHTDIANHPTWFISYTIGMDLGFFVTVTIVDGDEYLLYNEDGIYNLELRKLLINAPSNQNNIYAAGHYTDTITFTISAL